MAGLKNSFEDAYLCLFKLLPTWKLTVALTFQATIPAPVLQALKGIAVKMTLMSVPRNLVSMVEHVRTN